MLANLVKLTVVQWALLPLIAIFFNHDMTGADSSRWWPILFLHGLATGRARARSVRGHHDTAGAR